ncbi:MAG TPA: DIP1984 family protein [Tepidisphaeraceae bacterium]|nr:DIP1984 family protein [Tepidisphaeraceae bacterium]
MRFRVLTGDTSNVARTAGREAIVKQKTKSLKLAEALILRADLKKKLESLSARVSQYAAVQQGDKPHEDPNKLMKEAAGVLDEFESLVARVNRANLAARTRDGRTLTEALARRDALQQRHALVSAAIDGSSRPPQRYGLSEIKWVATLDVPRLQKQADDLSKQIRDENAAIQEANWRVDVPVQ